MEETEHAPCEMRVCAAVLGSTWTRESLVLLPLREPGARLSAITVSR